MNRWSLLESLTDPRKGRDRSRSRTADRARIFMAKAGGF